VDLATVVGRPTRADRVGRRTVLVVRTTSAGAGLVRTARPVSGAGPDAGTDVGAGRARHRAASGRETGRRGLDGPWAQRL